MERCGDVSGAVEEDVRAVFTGRGEDLHGGSGKVLDADAEDALVALSGDRAVHCGDVEAGSEIIGQAVRYKESRCSHADSLKVEVDGEIGIQIEVAARITGRVGFLPGEREQLRLFRLVRNHERLRHFACT